jgi:hypothetical protein
VFTVAQKELLEEVAGLIQLAGGNGLPRSLGQGVDLEHAHRLWLPFAFRLFVKAAEDVERLQRRQRGEVRAA